MTQGWPSTRAGGGRSGGRGRTSGGDRGWWWAPDGRGLPTRRSGRHAVATPGRWPDAEVSLHLLDLDGGWVDVHWDRETYPYLVSVPGPTTAAR